MGLSRRYPAYVTGSNDLLDDPSLEGWILSEPAIYDVAERFIAMEADDGPASVTSEALETELSKCCEELITPRRAEIIKRLLLTADYLQQTDSDERYRSKNSGDGAEPGGRFFAGQPPSLYQTFAVGQY